MMNQPVRDYAKKQGVFLWEVAEALGISEPTMTRWLRVNLSKERESELYSAIDRVAAQHAAQIAATATD